MQSAGFKLMMLTVAGFFASAIPGNSARSDVAYLTPGTYINLSENFLGPQTLRTFCYPGKRHTVSSLFETVEFILGIGSDDYSQYGGKTPEEVMQHYEDKQSLFSITLFAQKRQLLQLSPFDQQCIGISSRQAYTVMLNSIPLDLWRLSLFAGGIVIFLSAQRLAKNSVFYYLAGISGGICASLLVIVYFAAKLFPRRSMVCGVLIGGWTLGFYVLKQLANNLRLILITYRDHLLCYLGVTGLISFLICYRIGPPNNPRSQTIVMWVLQAIGGFMVYLSSWYTSAVALIMVLVFAAHYFPSSWANQIKTMYRRRFPPNRRMLTQEEYEEQTAVVTLKSLADLRQYVNSPECKQWAMMSKLRDPVRFASFANGAPHLDDEEIEDHSRTVEESMDAALEEELVDNRENKPEEYVHCSMYYRPLAGLSRHRVNIPLPNSRFRHQQAACDSEPDESEEEEFFEQEVNIRQAVQ
ncbi:nuclear envelope integral membrane protein 1 [Drosophila sechellia]|uniref:GM13381 n=1 Tax=Drosophila sechellia TaxID=7238 RepID=B4IEQ8_DROSE|nr:nuclear envelope integral membrane protein 1 [Drosophila sechellia]EDW46162.1 GM13381 [Drosophila sechellia]